MGSVVNFSLGVYDLIGKTHFEIKRSLRWLKQNYLNYIPSKNRVGWDLTL